MGENLINISETRGKTALNEINCFFVASTMNQIFKGCSHFGMFMIESSIEID